MRNVLLIAGALVGSLVHIGEFEGSGVTVAAPPYISTIHPYVRYPNAQNAAATTQWSVPSLCKAYSFPTGLAGNGVIGILEFGGGWNQADLNTFSTQYLGGKTISVTNVSIDGTQNNPGKNIDEDFEVALDIQCSVGAYYYATGKIPKVYVFFSNGDFVDTIKAAQTYGCDVLSISWGAPEADWQSEAPGYAASVESTAAAAVAKGLVIFAAAGDWSSSDDDGSTPHVDMPASAPHIIGCGGTTKTTSSEVVWGNGKSTSQGTGGGFSAIFGVTGWQTGSPTPPKGLGRMVPDVAADADPNTGMAIRVDGAWYLVGGTSGVAPLYSGLFAAIGKQTGFIAPTMWKNPKAFTDITSGSNGAYSASKGPDPCSGLGVPVGTSLATLFKTSTPASVVAVAYNTSSKTLTLTGDTSDNSITITQSGSTLQLQTSAGTNLTLSINSGTAGSPTTSATITGVSGSVTIGGNLSDGNDTVTFVGLSISTVTLELGNDNDSLTATYCTIGTLAVDGGSGIDVLTTPGTKVTSNKSTSFP